MMRRNTLRCLRAFQYKCHNVSTNCNFLAVTINTLQHSARRHMSIARGGQHNVWISKGHYISAIEEAECVRILFIYFHENLPESRRIRPQQQINQNMAAKVLSARKLCSDKLCRRYNSTNRIMKMNLRYLKSHT